MLSEVQWSVLPEETGCGVLVVVVVVVDYFIYRILWPGMLVEIGALNSTKFIPCRGRRLAEPNPEHRPSAIKLIHFPETKSLFMNAHKIG